MKSIIVKSCLLAVFVALVVADANAQRAGRRRTTNPPVNNAQQNQTSFPCLDQSFNYLSSRMIDGINLFDQCEESNILYGIFTIFSIK